jgi:hypothetical protein
MPRCARSGSCPRTASPARSCRAPRRSPGWPPCTRRRRPCGLPADSRVLNGHALAQGPRREPLLRQRAADDLRADRAHVPVRPLRAAGLAADVAPASMCEHSGCAWVVHLRCGRMPRCARSGAWATTASPARSPRASRRSPGWSTCAPRRRPCGLSADLTVRNGHAVAQGPPREPLLRQRAANDLRADRAHAPVRPHSGPPTGFR